MARDDVERKAVGAAIATLRKRRGLTQRELASAVGVSERAVQSWEQGYSHPYRHLRALEEVLGMTRRDLAASLSVDDLTAELRDQVDAPRGQSAVGRRVAGIEARLANLERRLAQLEKQSGTSRRRRA